MPNSKDTDPYRQAESETSALLTCSEGGGNVMQQQCKTRNAARIACLVLRTFSS